MDNDDAIDEIVARFADFQPGGGFDRARVVAWLGQFNAQHRELGIRLARSIQYYSTNSITNVMRPLFELIQTEVTHLGIDGRSVYYAPFGRTAESGQLVATRFRNANRQRVNNDQMIQMTDVVSVQFKHDGRVGIFLLDDFIGTGKQMCDQWDEVLSQIINPNDAVPVVAVVAAFADGIQRIQQNTPLRVIAVHTLDQNHRLGNAATRDLSAQDHRTIARYCESIGNAPMGFGDLGALVAFAHGTPNNTPSIIRGSLKQRPHRGLLPGWDDL